MEATSDPAIAEFLPSVVPEAKQIPAGTSSPQTAMKWYEKTFMPIGGYTHPSPLPAKS